MLIISDGSFRLSVRMPFTGVVDCSTCSKSPFAVKWVLVEDSNYKGLPEVIIERRFAILTSGTDAFPLSDFFALRDSFRGRLYIVSS